MRILRIFLLNLYTYQPSFYIVSRIGLPIFPKYLISLVSHVASSSLLSFVDLAIWKEHFYTSPGASAFNLLSLRNPMMPLAHLCVQFQNKSLSKMCHILIISLYFLPLFLDPADCFYISSLAILEPQQ